MQYENQEGVPKRVPRIRKLDTLIPTPYFPKGVPDCVRLSGRRTRGAFNKLPTDSRGSGIRQHHARSFSCISVEHSPARPGSPSSTHTSKPARRRANSGEMQPQDLRHARNCQKLIDVFQENSQDQSAGECWTARSGKAWPGRSGVSRHQPGLGCSRLFEGAGKKDLVRWFVRGNTSTIFTSTPAAIRRVPRSRPKWPSPLPANGDCMGSR